MKCSLKGLVFLILLLWLSSCSSPPAATIPPSPQPVSISFSPSLEPIREALHICTRSTPEMALFLEMIPESAQAFWMSDLILWWGEKPVDLDFAFPIAEDELVVIVNPDNPNTNLSASELRALFDGRIQHWSEISVFDQPVSVWIYPQGNLLGEIFKSEILDTQRFSRLAYLAPSPLPMLEAVAADPGGIGFVPRSWLSPEVSHSRIDPGLQGTLGRPILILAKVEPQAGLRSLLNCLQTGEGQKAIMDKYSTSN